jgi:hypothetical protein
MGGHLRRWVKRLAFAAAGAAIVYAAFFGPLPFVRSWWQAADYDYADLLHKRHRIADGLLLTGALVGKSRAEIVAMLGEPTETNDFSEEWGLVYMLGSERGLFLIDSEWLVVRMDIMGSVQQAAIVRD